MTVEQFPRWRWRGQRYARLPGVALRRPEIDVELVKADQARRYVIAQQTSDTFHAWVWYDTAQHRGYAHIGLVEAQRLYGEFTREIEDRRRDGWIDAAGGTEAGA